ncbi:pyruvate/2-oxoglutarate dehydrogenase complex dihydrolipoamide acyltransferase (E2) component [Xanthomonas sacchari]|uniref:hypothetical protein n=1 Tax=Xanthomonas sacchari TaxID=56458 RepID=UPI002789B734|nr:hypothetical protein [Xanthomonas sacchari]MDQ1094109.1 pyruvate/2-oxoglutarate dehydrogenase complex dihydrolipoamide acyltransferase (E2) component [Xanthomonas sacchari]
MKTPPTPLVFAGVVLLLGGIACAGGAWDTIRATLQAGPRLQAADPAAALQATAKPQSLAVTPAAPATAAPEPEPPAPHGNLLFDPARLRAARQALAALPGLQGHDLRVFHAAHFYDDRIGLELLDPAQPDHVDEYRFDHAGWHKEKPVNPRMFGPFLKPATDTAALQDIAFEGAYRVATALKEQGEALQAAPKEVDHVYVLVGRRGHLRWMPDGVQGDRVTVGIDFDAQGRPHGVQRH